VARASGSPYPGGCDSDSEIWASNGSETITMGQEQFAAFLTSEIARWAKVTRESGATLD